MRTPLSVNPAVLAATSISSRAMPFTRICPWRETTLSFLPRGTEWPQADPNGGFLKEPSTSLNFPAEGRIVVRRAWLTGKDESVE